MLRIIISSMLFFVLTVTSCSDAPGSQGRKGEVFFVETDVELNSDGSAVVAYTVQWRVIGDRMRGFLFSGNDRLRIGRFSSKSHAVDDAGNRYGLNIKQLSPDVYEIILAGGKLVRSGNVTYRFWFPTHFAKAAYCTPTTDSDGRELVVFK